jgi:geranylgeranylglycerol-phosphate geranylgeranyltransferase
MHGVEMKDQKISGLLTGLPRLFRIQLAIPGMICVLIGGVIGGFNYLNEDLFLAMIAVFFITSGSMAFNDYFDRDIDKKVHPDRPIPSGKIAPGQGLFVSIIFFIFSLVLSFLINPLCLIIAIITIDLLLFYELIFKNHGIVGNLVVAFIVAISFTYGGAAIGRPDISLDFTFIAFFMMLGREIIMDVTDLEGDKLYRSTLPMRIGKRNATYLGCFSLIISTIFLFMPGLIGIFPNYYLILILPVQALLYYSIILPLINTENTGRTADLILIAIAMGLPVFVYCIIV